MVDALSMTTLSARSRHNAASPVCPIAANTWACAQKTSSVRRAGMVPASARRRRRLQTERGDLAVHREVTCGGDSFPGRQKRGFCVTRAIPLQIQLAEQSQVVRLMAAQIRVLGQSLQSLEEQPLCLFEPPGSGEDPGRLRQGTPGFSRFCGTPLFREAEAGEDMGQDVESVTGASDETIAAPADHPRGGSAAYAGPPPGVRQGWVTRVSRTSSLMVSKGSGRGRPWLIRTAPWCSAPVSSSR